MPAPKPGALDGRKLARAREEAGLTRAQLAEKVGTTTWNVGKWEDGVSQPAPKRVLEIAETLGVDVLDLRAPTGTALALEGLRARAGLGQRALAAKVGVPQPTLSQWERGKAQVPDRLVDDYAEALGATADEVRAAARASEEAGATAEPKTAPRTMHVVVAYELAYEDDKLVRSSDKPVAVYSPQAGEAAGVEPEDGVQLVADVFARAAEDGAERPRALYTHHESRFTMDGEPVFAIRRQTRPANGDREALVRAMGVVLVPQWANPLTGEDDPAVKHAMRRELFDHLPPSRTGVGRLFIAAEPTDTYGWLCDQVEPDQGATAVFYEPGPPSRLGLVSHAAPDMLKTNGGAQPAVTWTTLDELGLAPDSTLREIAEAFRASR